MGYNEISDNLQKVKDRRLEILLEKKKRKYRHLVAFVIGGLVLFYPSFCVFGATATYNFSNGGEYAFDGGKIEFSSSVARLKSQGAPSLIWEKRFHTSTNDQSNGVAIDSQNNVIVTGQFDNGVNDDMYTIKYDSAGAVLWAKTYQYSPTSTDQGMGVAVDKNDDIIVVGTANVPQASYLAVKYDVNGNQIWAKTFTPTGFTDMALDVATDSGNNVLMTGFVAFGTSNWNICTIKLDSNGNSLWQKTYDSGTRDMGQGVAVDGDNNVLVSGTTNYTGNANYLTIKYDISGNVLWQRSYDGGSADSGEGVAADTQKNVFVTGTSRIGGVDRFYAIKYDTLGTELNQVSYNVGAVNYRSYSVHLDSTDNVIIVGDFSGVTRNAVLLKYDNNFNQLWTKNYAGPQNYDYWNDVATDFYDSVIVTGTSRGSPGNEDYLTIKYPLGAFDAAGPELSPNSFFSANRLDSFTESLGSKNQGEIKYQVSRDGGSTWHYWNGAAWTPTVGGAGDANTLADLNAHLPSFGNSGGPPASSGNMKFKAYFVSDGKQRTEIDNLDLNYTVDVTPPEEFILLSPTNNEHVATKQPTFSWQKPNDAGVGIWKYQLFIDSNLVQDNINPSGGSTESYTLNAGQALNEGDHPWYVKAFDRAGNERNSGGFTVAIDLENDPPVLKSNIPNQTWAEDTNLGDAFDLDNYFEDLNPGDSLTYTVAADKNPAHVRIEINPTSHQVSFEPQPNWTGSEEAVFAAADKNNLSTRSNNVLLTVNQLNDNPTAPTAFSPANGETVLNLHPVLSWNEGSDPEDSPAALFYRIRLGRNSNPEANYEYFTETRPGETSLTVAEALVDKEDYHYVVQTVDSENLASSWSAPQSFHLDTGKKNVVTLTKSFTRSGINNFAAVINSNHPLLNLSGNLGLFSRPRDLAYLFLIFFLAHLVFIFKKAVELCKENSKKANIKNVLLIGGYLFSRQIKNAFLTIFYLGRKSPKAFIYVYNQDKKGIWQASYDEFKRNRRIAWYVLTGLTIFFAVEILLGTYLSSYYPRFLALGESSETILPGEEINFNVAYENIGSHEATALIFSDSLSSSLQYVPGSLKLGSGAKTDPVDGDEMEAAGSQVKLKLTKLAPGDKGSFSFKVKAKETVKQNTIVTNAANVVYQPENVQASSNILSFNAEALGEIGGVVFNDLNRSKTQNINENGLAGVTVRLYNDINENGLLEAGDGLITLIKTDAAGRFNFTKISSGFYLIQVVEEDLPNYRLSSLKNPGQAVLKTSLEKYSMAEFGYYYLGGGEAEAPTPSPAPTPTPEPEPQPTKAPTPEPIPTPTPAAPTTEKHLPDQVLEGVVGVLSAIEKFFIKPKGGEATFTERAFEPVVNTYREIRTNPIIQLTNQSFFAPASALMVTTSFIATVPLVSSFIPLIQYLLQFALSPMSFFSRGRVKRWGVVYDSLSKEPLDLVLLRLVDAKTNKIISTKVTGADGKYFFLVESNHEYRLEIQKSQYLFPSKYLKNLTQDEVFSDLYFGQSFKTGREENYLTKNIPLDLLPGQAYMGAQTTRPVKTVISSLEDFSKQTLEQLHQENEKILRHDLYRKISQRLAYFGPFLSLGSYLISPSNFTFILFIVNIIILIVFRRLGEARSKIPTGKVFDKESKRELNRAVVRLFDPKFGRLISTHITDRAGRYGFLAKSQEYLLTCDKEKYLLPEKYLKVKSKEGYINQNVALAKKTSLEKT